MMEMKMSVANKRRDHNYVDIKKLIMLILL